MGRKQDQDKIDKARIPLWTARDLVFATGVIPRFTKCEKPPYSPAIKSYLKKMNMEDSYRRPPSRPKPVCVKLRGKLRYLWRIDVLTEREYEDVRQKERNSVIAVLGSKSEGVVDQGDSD